MRLSIKLPEDKLVYEIPLQEYYKCVLIAYNEYVRKKKPGIPKSKLIKDIRNLPYELKIKYKTIHQNQVKMALLRGHLMYFIAKEIGHIDLYPHLKIFHERRNVSYKIKGKVLKLNTYNDLIGIHRFSLEDLYDIYLLFSEYKVNKEPIKTYQKSLDIKNVLLKLDSEFLSMKKIDPLSEEVIRKAIEESIK